MIDPYNAYNISVFDEISVFYRNQRGLNLNEYELQLARKTDRPAHTEPLLLQQHTRKAAAWLSHWSRPDS